MREFVFSTFIVILLPDHRRDSLTASHVSTFPYPAVFLPISNIPGAPGAKENDDDARVIVGNTRNNRARPIFRYRRHADAADYSFPRIARFGETCQRPAFNYGSAEIRDAALIDFRNG